MSWPGGRGVSMEEGKGESGTQSEGGDGFLVEGRGVDATMDGPGRMMEGGGGELKVQSRKSCRGLRKAKHRSA